MLEPTNYTVPPARSTAIEQDGNKFHGFCTGRGVIFALRFLARSTRRRLGIIRLTYALVDIWCRSYQKPPGSVVLDIDDTVDVVHGHQQLAQWNAHYDERCFLPIHVYDAATGAPVTVILRPGKTPSGVEVRKLLSRLIGRIRRHWPNTHITISGDGHYGREEAMTWCENYGIDYIFGLSGNVVLDRLVEAAADDIRVRRAVNQAEVLRGFAETRYAAKSWDKERWVVAQDRGCDCDQAATLALKAIPRGGRLSSGHKA